MRMAVQDRTPGSPACLYGRQCVEEGGTLFETTAGVFADAVISGLMEAKGIDAGEVWDVHARKDRTLDGHRCAERHRPPPPYDPSIPRTTSITPAVLQTTYGRGHLLEGGDRDDGSLRPRRPRG
ncbi:hypothetical protein [Methanofollis fontis]|uniref:hypothetical protein n=1 Tax=Methanofollis fontis TaxID=2052832 RepID=UPI00102F2256|nr:hypothetical protein [Methanofollis fontis]